MRIAVGVVLYNPSYEELLNINTYIDNVDHVLIYDNSDEKNIAEIKEVLTSNTFTYFYNGNNDGISKSFNRIFREAQSLKIDYILLLDQDSVIEDFNIDVIKKNLSKAKKSNYCLNVPFNKINEKEANNVIFAITSGMIIKTDFFLTIGGYDENLFIDGVDHDYCLRLLEVGESISLIKNVCLNQQLGRGKKNLFGVYEHTAIRNYYIFRNRLYLIKKHSHYYSKFKKIRSLYLSIFKQILSIIFFEKNKLQKLKFISIAYKDFKNEKFGKFSW